jgi:TetR/AcrR family transcriptional regulator, cholesterol catabolism regulator
LNYGLAGPNLFPHLMGRRVSVSQRLTVSTQLFCPSPRQRGRHAIPRLRERILTSAQELFAHNGFDKVTTDQVAASARVGKGSVYRQFGSKESLYVAAITAAFSQLRNQIDQALQEENSFPERIAAIVRHVLSFVWDRGDFFALLRDPSALQPHAAERYQQERKELSLLIRKTLNDGAAAGWMRGDLNLQLVAESILGMIRGVRRYRDKEVVLEESAQTITALLLDGCLADRTEKNRYSPARSSGPYA